MSTCDMRCPHGFPLYPIGICETCHPKGPEQTSATPRPWGASEVAFGEACEHCGHVVDLGTQIVIHGPPPARQRIAAIAPPNGQTAPTPTNRANADTILAAVLERDAFVAALEEASKWILPSLIPDPERRQKATKALLRATELVHRARSDQ